MSWSSTPCCPGSRRLRAEGRSASSRAANLARPVVHAAIPELNHIYGTIVDGEPRRAGSRQSNCCIFADRPVDRSPTGSGTAGRTAIPSARGLLADGENRGDESLIGTTMSARVVRHLDFHGRSAIMPEVSGTAHLLGRA